MSLSGLRYVLFLFVFVLLRFILFGPVRHPRFSGCLSRLKPRAAGREIESIGLDIRSKVLFCFCFLTFCVDSI